MRLVFFIAAVLSNPAPNKGLYNEDDFVEILDKDNFDFAVGDVSKLWIIEFYASWCGHCQHFAPIVRGWSEAIRNWGRLVSIGVIDCGNNENSEICRRNGIQGYPTMKYFPIGPRDWKKKNDFRSHDFDGLIENTLDVIAQNIPKKVKITFNCTDFDSLDKIQTLQSNEPSIIVIDRTNEKGDHTLARRVASELTTFNDISIHRVDVEPDCNPDDPCHDENSLCCHFKAKSFPALFVQQMEKQPHLLETDGNEIEQYVNAVASHLDVKTSHNWEQQSHIQDKAAEALDTVKWRKFDQRRVHLRDIESSILQLLFYEIKEFPFQGEKLKKIQSIIAVLFEHYPPTSRNIRKSLVHVGEALKHEKVFESREDWVQLLTNSGLEGELIKIEYAACTGSDPNKRGYSCSLWTLFHFLLATADDAKSTALIISSIVTDFFGCLNCVENFQNELNQFPIENISDKNSGVLWLWRLHNSVNERLAGESSEDPFFPKEQWPTKEVCPRCRLVSDEGQFDEEKVAGFLIRRNEINQLVLSDGESLTSEDNEAKEVVSEKSESSHSGVIWFITVLMTVCGLWLYKHYRVKLILKRNYRKFYHQM